MWWRMFERHEVTVEERFDDRDCLAQPDPDRHARPEDQALPGLRVPLRPGAGDQAATPGTSASSPARTYRAEIVAMDEDAGWWSSRSAPSSRCPTSCA